MHVGKTLSIIWHDVKHMKCHCCLESVFYPNNLLHLKKFMKKFFFVGFSFDLNSIHSKEKG